MTEFHPAIESPYYFTFGSGDDVTENVSQNIVIQQIITKQKVHDTVNLKMPIALHFIYYPIFGQGTKTVPKYYV